MTAFDHAAAAPLMSTAWPQRPQVASNSVALAVILAHVLLVMLWLRYGSRVERWLVSSPAMIWVAAPTQPATRQALPAPAGVAPTPKPIRRTPRRAATATQPQNTISSLAPAVQPPSVAASTAQAVPSMDDILHGPATLAAVHDAASVPLNSERYMGALAKAPLTQREILARAVSDSAFGDCLKGEFAGAGMGLISIPFFLLAEAAGRCSQRRL